MDTTTQTNQKAVKAVQVLAIVSAVIGIVSLFLNWVDINVVYNFMGMDIPVTMKATAINVIEGNIGIPDDWHIYMPALAGIIPVIGALIAVLTFFKPQIMKTAAPLLIIIGFASITCACLFYAWEFDVMYDASAYGLGNVCVGYMCVRDVIVDGFYASLVAGVLLIITGLADAYLSKE